MRDIIGNRGSCIGKQTTGNLQGTTSRRRAGSRLKRYFSNSNITIQTTTSSVRRNNQSTSNIIHISLQLKITITKISHSCHIRIP